MSLDIKAPENVILQPVITVFGVGGAGGNAVNNMIKSNLKGANFVVANTDAQALTHSESSNKIQLGAFSTKGLGAGASPEIGKEAAIETEDEIRAYLENSNMLFITAGMGGGTGTGASPVIAKLAKELGVLTVGVVTKPFLFEGAKRMRIADKGLSELQKYVDTLIVIPNQNLFRIANENTTFQEAFALADEVLHAGVRGVTDLITSPGLVNLDFADIETVMSEKGKAMMGTGEASGENRAINAAESAIANPLLDQSSMCGACGVLINITGGKDMTLYEVDNAANRVREEVGDSDANIIFGSTFNPDLEGTIRVSVVATGIEQDVIVSTTQDPQAIANFKSSDHNITALSGFEAHTQNHASDIHSSDHVLNSDLGSISDTDDHNTDVTDNIAIDDHIASSYQETNNSSALTEQELQSKLNELTKQINLNRNHSNLNYSNTHNTLTNSSQVEATKLQNNDKLSLLKRMWNSLKSSDSNNTKTRSNRPMEYATAGSTKTESHNAVQETPNLFKKD